MSLTSKQIDELRAYATDRKGELAKLISDAADTIEMLSAKLHVSQMERSSQYYHGGWIPCSERLPKKPGWYICSIKDGRVNSLYYEQRLGWINTAKKHMFELYDIYSKLTGTKIKPEQECIDWNGLVIAWMPLPEPYQGGNE